MAETYKSADEVLNEDQITNTFTAEYPGPISATAIITPNTGCKLRIRGVYICTTGNSGNVTLSFATTGTTVAKIYPDTDKGVAYIPMKIDGDDDEALTLSSTTETNRPVFVLVNYKEIG